MSETLSTPSPRESDDPPRPETLAANAPAKPDPAYGRRLDRIEQTLIVLAYAGYAFSIVYSALQKPTPGELIGSGLALAAESMVLVFVLIRRPSNDISPRVSEWMLAVGATLAPLFTRPLSAAEPALVPSHDSMLALGAAMLLIGMILQVIAKFTLGRSFGILPANRGLVLSGPYRFVRHPIYLGYAFCHIGVLLMWPTLWNFSVLAVGWVLQILRLLAEERWLGADPNYREYQQAVPYRLIPGVF